MYRKFPVLELHMHCHLLNSLKCYLLFIHNLETLREREKSILLAPIREKVIKTKSLCWIVANKEVSSWDLRRKRKQLLFTSFGNIDIWLTLAHDRQHYPILTFGRLSCVRSFFPHEFFLGRSLKKHVKPSYIQWRTMSLAGYYDLQTCIIRNFESIILSYIYNFSYKSYVCTMIY